jgi:hypothetical protein
VSILIPNVKKGLYVAQSSLYNLILEQKGRTFARQNKLDSGQSTFSKTKLDLFGSVFQKTGWFFFWKFIFILLESSVHNYSA